MAAQPFDKETIDKITSAFNNLNSETTKTLSQLEASVEAEKQMVDIAKQLGQVYKTQQDKLNDQLKGKNLQEKLQEKLKNSEKELADFAQARINSFLKINSLQEELNATSAQLLIEQNKDPHSDKVKELLNTIQSKDKELNLEQDLLSKSGEINNFLQIKNDLLKLGNKLLEIYNNLLDKAKKGLDMMVQSANSLMTKLNMPTTVFGTFEKILNIFNQIDTAATNIRQKFGLLSSQGEIFEKNIREASIELASFGITAEELGGTMKSIGSTFTSLQSMEKGLVKDVSLMSAQFGVSADTSVKFLQTLGGVSGKSAIAKQNMLGLAKFAANAYGVGLDDVMGDVANASDEARMFAGKNADEMVRAAAQARQMGTTLDNMARTAKGLLDFESSIQSELKASALIGKNINFNEARRLAFQGKIAESNKVILDQAKKIKFNQLNPIAQEAFAKAAGKSVKELQDMLNAEENLNAALKSKDPMVKAEAEKRKKMSEMMQKDPIAAKKAAQAEYEKGLIQEKNQTRMKQLQNEINAIFMEFIGPILEGIGPIFTDILKYIRDNRDSIKSFTIEVGKLFLAFKSLEIISKLSGIIGKLISGVGSFVKLTSSLSGGLLKATGFMIGLAKNVNPIVISMTSVTAQTQKFASLLQSASTKVKGFGSGFQNISKFIGAGASQVQKLSTVFSKIKFNLPVGKIANVFSNVFTKVGGSVKKIGSLVGGVFGKLGSGVGIFSKLGPLFGAVSKFLGPIGIVISTIQAGIAFFKAFSETTGTTSQKAVAGLKAVVNVLVIEPLKMIWDFIKKIPTFLAEVDFGAIYKDVTTYLLDALTSLPEKIEELFSGEGGGGIDWGNIFYNIGNLFFQMFMFSAIKLPIAMSTLVVKLGVLIVKGIGSLVLNLGILILKGIASIGMSLLELIMWPFKKALKWVEEQWGGKSPSKIGLAIVDGIKSVVDMLFDLITYPFKKAAEIIPEMINILKTTFVDAFKSIVDVLFDLITYPFEKASQIIPEMINILKTTFVDAFKSIVDVIFDLITYPFEKAFQLIKSTVSEVGSVLKDTFSGAFTFIINALEKVLEKLKGVGEFITGLVGKGFKFVGKILGVTDEPTDKSTKVDEKYKQQGLQTDSIINAIVSSNKAVVEKLDKLTSMMASGQIAVYIDGQRANQLLATSNSKFGSFGQATTN